jgi:hypothetical protein
MSPAEVRPPPSLTLHDKIPGHSDSGIVEKQYIRSHLSRALPSRNTALMDRAVLLDRLTAAVARARNHEPATDWDRQAAEIALRRWQSFSRRHKTGNDESRNRDLARGLLERLDPERMDEPGWHVWTAEAAADVLRQSFG